VTCASKVRESTTERSTNAHAAPRNSALCGTCETLRTQFMRSAILE
jgi:hypothetical protein